jgi:mycothiol synthase
MPRVRILHAIESHDRAAIEQFLLDAHADDCAQLNDHLRADLTQGPRPGFVAALATQHDALVGYAQASAGNAGFVVDSIVGSDVDADIDTVRADLLGALLDALPDDAAITWWTHDTDDAAPVVEALGLVPGRALLHMRVPLPLPSSTVAAANVTTRPFEVGHDEAAWLDVNNAAFAWHGEQGGWDLDTLQQRLREPWFRADGFLLHERDGRLAAFCWTKLHHPAHTDEPLVGEIYVIAVHPDFHGLGLGRSLTVAGLHSLAGMGSTEGMLYVDAGNTAAVRLYESLGFRVAHTDQAYVRPARMQLP